jgi:hypothetical protein
MCQWSIGLCENLADYKKKNIIFNSAMQFKLVSNGFILNTYCINELHDMKNELRFGYICNRFTLLVKSENSVAVSKYVRI